ncbi:uncharacterized protein LOC129285571 [Prosopis cineraria]|uniref:uncharacterized protein LOC129285571 n=1 Tax=Prosopis cineraria TaxID=364024 RepID=UPI00240F948C|nr:uncharacterized protein LOC129285571 [Prosopis cineraria]
MEELHGAPEDSYKLISWICQRLTEKDLRTIAKWTACRDNSFKRLFIAYGCCIDGFLNGCRPILYIDRCHLSGPYKRSLLSASTHNVGNDLFSVAYAIVSGEKLQEWTWFMHNLKDIMGSLEVTIVFDRHNAIISAVEVVFRGNRHAFCYRHMKENFNAEFVKIGRRRRRATTISKEDALKLLDAIAYARINLEFNRAMGNLRAFCPELAQWLETNGDINRWALSKFPFHRWDNITNNLSESFNAWLVKERKHSVVTLLLKHQEKLASKMYASKVAMSKWQNGVGPNIEEKLKANVARVEVMLGNHHSGNLLSVKIGDIHLRVDLSLRECTCQAWQMSEIPCAHACVAIKKVYGNVYSYVEGCYNLRSQEKIYKDTTIPIETNDMPRVNALTIIEMMTKTFLKPPTTSCPSGRPQLVRRESQSQGKKIYHYVRYGQSGHTHRTC